MSQLKLLLVDDNRRFMEIAADFLSSHPGIEIIGLAHSGLEALRLLENLSPDLVLMDISMPDMNGLEATRKIRARPFPPQVVILTMYEGAEFCALAQNAGADGFITKADFGDSLWPLIMKLFPRLRTEPAHELA
jgi:DNA-binding NarL/FixJ family response regulator